MTTWTKSISIVVPAYNEEEGIGDFLLATSKTLKSEPFPWEIIVVDNGSSDSTCEIVERFMSDTRIRLLRNESNRGKGYSIRRGMLEAQYETRLMCDADCASSLESLGRMEEALSDAQIIVGSRLASGSDVGRKQSLRRRVVGTAFLILTRVIIGNLARDVYCGFKLWTGEAAEAVFPVVTLDGWVFDAEALALGKKLGFDIAEVGIHWIDRPNSRLSIRAVLIPAVTELLRARRSVRRVPTPTSK